MDYLIPILSGITKKMKNIFPVLSRASPISTIIDVRTFSLLQFTRSKSSHSFSHSTVSTGDNRQTAPASESRDGGDLMEEAEEEV